MTKITIEQDATLYVDGELTKHGQCYKAETQCILLLASYCKKLQLDLVLVCDAKEVDIGEGLQISSDCFTMVENRRESEIPNCVKDCKLPAVCSVDQVNVYSGLCTVLRYIVKRAAHLSATPDGTELLSLLGHRLYCLKSCSEVSPRTKLCEIHMPQLINVPISETDNIDSHIPEAISSFEMLMRQPVVIHNMDKRQRVLLKKLDSEPHNPAKMQKISNHKAQKRVVWTKDLPPLEHVFAEGVDFTLSDLCIFPCIHYFLKTNILAVRDKIPRTLKWYSRMKAVPRLKTALTECNVSFLPFGKDLNDVVLKECSDSNGTEVIELASNKDGDDPKNSKRGIDMTIRRDLPALLKKLSPHEVETNFSEFKREDISLNWSSFPKELHPIEGELSSLRALRKCHQIENLAHAVQSIAKSGDSIVDFCSGGGHVGIVLAHLLPDCRIILVENKEESLDRARARISSLEMKNITIYQCNLEYFRGSFEIGVALHACGVASDMVVQSCISRNASFVISPCCYGKVRNCHWISYPQSKLYRSIPISFEESLLLGHAADKTSWNFENKHAVEGKLCMGLVDTDRANAAKEHCYDIQLYTMQPHTCSPKNNMLVGKTQTSL